MFTPPNQPSSSGSRRRPLPSRSSLSNSFSFSQTPQKPPGWDDSELDIDTSSVSFAHVRRRLSISEQGNRGIGQVSPRLRPGTPARASTSTRTVTQPPPLPRVRSRLGHGHATPDTRRSPMKAQDISVEIEADHVMGEEDSDEDEEEVTWSMIDSMRLWRNDAIMQHLYETAAFWGNKILSWTGKLPLTCFSRLKLMISRPKRRILASSDLLPNRSLPSGGTYPNSPTTTSNTPRLQSPLD